MIYTSDWFGGHIEVWQKCLAPFVNKPNINYLEVGVFEGRSAFWMLENILTDPSSRLTLVDPLYEQYELAFWANLAQHPRNHQIQLHRSAARQALRKLPLNKYDIIYIDGSHHATDVYIDIALSWDLLKPEGVLILDDFLFEQKNLPLAWRPQTPIEAFLVSFRENIEVLNVDWQVLVRKKQEVQTPQSFFGHYKYDWQTQEIYKAKTGEKISVNEELKNRVRDYFLNLNNREPLRGFTELSEERMNLAMQVEHQSNGLLPFVTL